jgi:hypothetical protein
MKTRDVVIFNGKRFKVPQCIQRIDHRYTHGWQVRYGGTKMFSDGTNDGSGAAASLEAATKELIRRIATMPTPSKLQPAPSAGKASGLPVGISGPLVRMRTGSSTRYASLQVLLPRFGQKPQNKNVYIGSESTYTVERFQEALARAVQMRADAEAAYRIAETKARRADARALKASMAAGGPVPAPRGKAAAKAAVGTASGAAGRRAAAGAKSTARPARRAVAPSRRAVVAKPRARPAASRG